MDVKPALPERMACPELVAVDACGALNQLELKIRPNSETERTERGRTRIETKRTAKGRTETRRIETRQTET